MSEELLQLAENTNENSEKGLTVISSLKTKRKSGKNSKKDKEKISGKTGSTENADEFEEFPDLAKLMNTTVEALKDEFFLFQIRKLMSKMAQAVVRYSVSDDKMMKFFHNSKALGLDGIVVAPAYLPVCEKQVEKLGGYKVGAIVDFPFGESAVKSKISGIADCKNRDVDDVTVMMPTLLLCKTDKKLFKKQIAKYARCYRGHVGIGLNATDLTEEQISLAMKIASKTKVEFVTFIFGSATSEELNLKMSVVKKYKSNKKVFVLANVERAEAVMELYRLDVDRIITPYADDIGKDLVKKFKVKSVKLV